MKKIRCLNICDILERGISNLDYKNYERFYIGSYFCGKYFIHMKTEQIDALVDLIQKENNKKHFITLVIPMFGQHDLDQGKQKIAELLDRYHELIDEVTVNDFGMLTYIGEVYDYPMNIGRLLNKDYRDMRYEDYYNSTIQPKIFTKYFDRLRKLYRIRGAEFDPTNKSIDFSKAPEHIMIGLHSPFCYITTGQICEFASIDKHLDQKYRPNSSCANECSKYHILYMPKDDVTWFRLGRAVYFHNEDVELKGLKELREIYFPIEELSLTDRREQMQHECTGTGK